MNFINTDCFYYLYNWYFIGKTRVLLTERKWLRSIQSTEISKGLEKKQTSFKSLAIRLQKQNQ